MTEPLTPPDSLHHMLAVYRRRLADATREAELARAGVERTEAAIRGARQQEPVTA